MATEGVITAGRVAQGAERAAPPHALTAVIIDATRGERRLDSRRSEPASFTRIDGQGRVLDWILHALRANDARQITFVGGYHIQKVIEQYPELQFRFLAGWMQRGEVEALRTAGLPRRGTDVLIARATSLCLPEAVVELRRSRESVTVGLYGSARGRTAWAGVMHVPDERAPDVFEVADELATNAPGASLTELIAALEGRGVPIERVLVDQLAAPLDDDAAVAEIAFRGKARTLEQLAPMVRSAVVPESMRVSVSAWRSDAAAILAAVRERFGEAAVAVRSSAACEDALTDSLAGRFRSVLNVSASDANAMRDAIERVVSSYEQHDRAGHEHDEFIVQRQVCDLATSGVLLTRDLSTGGPYYVVHVDRMDGEGDSPDRVTAGVAQGASVQYVLRRDDDSSIPQGEVGKAVTLARELEKLMCRDAIDIEFGVTRDGVTNLLQVRPMTQESRAQRLDEDLQEECALIHAHLTSAMGAHPQLVGATTVFSTMADWNPAEMIGPAPKPLAMSLYQRLIGSDAWSRSRAMLGYRNVWPVQLIHSLGGRPFVDVRASLNSLLPAAIDDAVAARLVDAAIEQLRRDPSGHDKIEFECTHSCATLDAEGDHAKLRSAGLSDGECADVQGAMAALTSAMIAGAHCGGAAPMAQLEALEYELNQMRAMRPTSLHGQAAHVQMILAKCVESGVTPFAVLARQAFVSLAMLRAMTQLGVLAQENHDRLLQSIPTVASELDRDLQRCAAGLLDRNAIIARYGHLRPNSYDVTSQSYAESWDAYFATAPDGRAFPDVNRSHAILREAQRDIEALLTRSNVNASFEQWCAFIITSIQRRERGKFIFMKAVNDVLQLTMATGAKLGVSREDMALLPIGAVESLAVSSPSGAVEMEWRRLIEFNRKRWALTSALRLPGLIRSADDVFAFEVEGARPTFVSQRRVSGRVVCGDDVRSRASAKWNGAIVLLRAADPGYDWLFGAGIAGLITAWGGAGSHMAIRAAEFGLPAAIGCGELMYESLVRASRIELDCGVQTIRVLS